VSCAVLGAGFDAGADRIFADDASLGGAHIGFEEDQVAVTGEGGVAEGIAVVLRAEELACLMQVQCGAKALGHLVVRESGAVGDRVAEGFGEACHGEIETSLI
jgi:hypothetical protein